MFERKRAESSSRIVLCKSNRPRQTLSRNKGHGQSPFATTLRMSLVLTCHASIATLLLRPHTTGAQTATAMPLTGRPSAGHDNEPPPTSLLRSTSTGGHRRRWPAASLSIGSLQLVIGGASQLTSAQSTAKSKRKGCLELRWPLGDLTLCLSVPILSDEVSKRLDNRRRAQAWVHVLPVVARSLVQKTGRRQQARSGVRMSQSFVV